MILSALLCLLPLSDGPLGEGPPSTPVRVERRAAVMGTTVDLRVEAAGRERALAASEQALRALESADRRLSTWGADSELARLNDAAPGEELVPSAELARELGRALHWRAETGGAFDPAIGDLVALHGLRAGGRAPGADEVERVLARRTRLAEEGRGVLELRGDATVRGPAELRFDEGGFGKGAGLDAALAALARPDDPAVRSVLLDLGGQVAVRGEGSFELRLADPRDRDRPVLAYTIEAGSVATSGTSTRGRHLLDPRTALPAAALPEGSSVSVWAASALDADCLSTGLFVLGADGALAFARAHPGIEALVLTPAADGTLLARASAGWLGRLEVLAEGVALEVELAEASDPRRAALGWTAPVAAAGALAQDPDQDADRLTRLEARNEELERRLDVLAGELESRDLAAGGVTVAGELESRFGMGPAASKVYGVQGGVSLGGYGEALFEGFDSDRDDGSSGNTDRADFLRAILYAGYKFDEHWVFNSEIEFEHASTEEDGAVSVEFAYLEYLHAEELNARAGLLLVPMGLVNELHEPTSFPTAKRPGVESVILPSTWRENGVGLLGSLGDFDYKAYLVNGLDGSGFGAGGLRDGRQDGSKALAEDWALVGRLDWKGVTGLTLGGSVYQGDSAQDLSGVDLDTSIVEAHADLTWRGLHLRALAARAQLDDVDDLNNALGLVGNASVGEELEGYYVELGYDVLAAFRPESRQSLMPFVRYEEYDTQAEVPSGFSSDPANDVEITTFGVAYKPHPQIVIKLDYMDVDNGAGSGQDQFNIGLGYVF